LEVTPLFQNPEHCSKFNVILEGLLHAVPVLDAIVGVMLGDLLEEKPCIELTRVLSVDQLDLGNQRAFRIRNGTVD
jgi:hypothetical protein